MPRRTQSGGTLVMVTVVASFIIISTANGGVLRRISCSRKACCEPSSHQRCCFELGPTTRIADPKLSGGGVRVSFRLHPVGITSDVVVEVLRGCVIIQQIWSGTVQGGGNYTELFWDGKDAAENYAETGDYVVRVRSTTLCVKPAQAPLSIVRLGITEIAAQNSTAVTNEWQMVYFMKGSNYEFFATPALHEYLSKAESGEVSDLDLDNGDPRPIPAVHNATDSPLLEGANYEDDAYNYPLCYLMGAQPRLEVTFGASATTASGIAISTGYPLTGFEIRAQARVGGIAWSSSGPIVPGGTAAFTGPVLPCEVTRIDRSIEFVWQYRATYATAWCDVPGSVTIPLRFYTLIGEPQFKDGASGTQYSGPWVEVAEYWYQWRRHLGIPVTSEAGCVETHVKGFFGQNAGIATAIEGMIYDAGPLGGDSGTNYYHSVLYWEMNLSALLNGHDTNLYFNCTDNMGATTTMLAMMGVSNIRPVKLTSMKLRAIWGIGAPIYTTELFGPLNHSFSFHRLVTRDNGVRVIDTCLQLDEDGDPNATPGRPGWNTDRVWNGLNGYESLSASNPVTQTLGSLPGLK